MADTGYTTARECVECGNHFEADPSIWGRPRKRCLTCSPRRPGPPPKGRRKGPRPKNITATCLACGSSFMAATAKAKVCGPACRWRYNHPGWMPMEERNEVRRVASIESRAFRCQGCGTDFTAKRTDRTKFCSRQCAFTHAKLWLSPAPRQPRPGPSPEALALKREVRALKEIGRRMAASLIRAQAMGARRLRALAPCETCYRPIGLKNLKGGPRRFCSSACLKASPAYLEAKRTHRRARKAKLRNVRTEPVNAIKVLERDGWRCQICGCSTPKALRGSYHPRAPELDHIVALAKGGDHSYQNTQCACRRCNGIKSDKDISELRLAG